MINSEYHMLLISQDYSTFATLNFFLTELKCSLDWVKNSKEAIDKVQKNKYCLILTEDSFPQENLFPTIQKIRSINQICREVPIVALTNHFTAKIIQEAIASNTSALTVKPVMRSALYKILTGYLDNEPVFDDQLYFISETGDTILCARE